MECVSIIIPTKNERYLGNTVKDVIEKAHEEIEVLFMMGADMREAINLCVDQATGKYIMKLDAHCMVDDVFDVKLKKVHKPNWVQVPTRKRLIAGEWRVDDSKPDINHMYIGPEHMGIANRTQECPGDTCATEIFQGSCYFIEKDYFKGLELLDYDNFGGSGFEALEIVTKVRHDGGRVVRNKSTWYAHARLGRKYINNRDKSRSYVEKFLKTYG